MNGFNLAVCQPGHIHSLAIGYAQKIVGGDSEELCNTNECIESRVAHAVLVFADYGLGQPHSGAEVFLR